MSVHTRIKFCGLTRPQDVDLAVSLGVDLIGLVFAARSARRVDLTVARGLRQRIPSGVEMVALMMDNPAEEVANIADILQPDVLQFHGQEAEAFCARFGVPFFKAIAVADLDASQVSERIATWPSARALLFDGHAAGEMGGSGRSFDWRILPRAGATPFLLAGGLDAGNVEDAIHEARPWGVDVSSGIESAPGIKDAQRMRAFVAAARRADAAA
ncbi:MAG TPA: phosphoribosylanthranilate isomerase [Chiayiivirga sp.]|nr:phosphoribosylanthranilate isomerase [Chiayiivirga sp.]